MSSAAESLRTQSPERVEDLRGAAQRFEEKVPSQTRPFTDWRIVYGDAVDHIAGFLLINDIPVRVLELVIGADPLCGVYTPQGWNRLLMPSRPMTEEDVERTLAALDLRAKRLRDALLRPSE